MKYWFSMTEYLLCWESGYIHASYILRPFLPLRCTIAPLWMPEGWLDLLGASLTQFLWNAPCITNLPSQTDFSGHYFKNNHFDAIFWRKSRHRYIILIDKDNSSAWPPVVWLFKFLKQTSFSQFIWTEKTRELNCIV